MWPFKRCKIKDACSVILGGYEKGIPERCKECTDLVKFTVSCIIFDEAKTVAKDSIVLKDYGHGV